MDSSLQTGRDEAAELRRLEDFKLGGATPSSRPGHVKARHSRSHSRNTSISSVSSLPTLASSKSETNVYDMGTSNPMTFLPPTPSTRNSHHRRLSSVSTRRESAEMMGVALPDLPTFGSDDIGFGDKDSLRRRALWALEGKQDPSFSRVEIPDMSTPEIEKRKFDLSSRPSFPPSSNPSFAASLGSGLSSLMATKRDSFKHLAASSSSKELGIVVEEEEEDLDVESHEKGISESSKVVAPLRPTTPVTPPIVCKRITRPRPPSLRPLSLTPENLALASNGLPTPSPTPGPRPGLKSLSLNPSRLSIDDSTNTTTNMTRRNSLTLAASPTPRRPALNLQIYDTASSTSSTSSNDENKAPVRRSSISYITSSAGLPTPEMTPTSSERRLSASTYASSRSSVSSGPDGVFNNTSILDQEEESFFLGNAHHPPVSGGEGSSTRQRPLSVSEQHFLFKSHNALLSRIQDLERALSLRRRESSGFEGISRPPSVVSDISISSVSSEPSDEMLRLVADLKAERDELKRDVNDWRVRVGDLEKQLGVFAKRVENERREAWVARSRVGLLETEKAVMEKEMLGRNKHLDDVRTLVEKLEAEKIILMTENESLKVENQSLSQEKQDVEDELQRWRNEADQLKNELADNDVLATPTPQSSIFSSRKRGLGLSLGSESSTDVELDTFHDSTPHFDFSLKSVSEESDVQDQLDDLSDEEDNGLAGYEDEEDSDASFSSPIRSSSSFGSEFDFPRSVEHRLDLDVPTSPITPGTNESSPVSRVPMEPAPATQLPAVPTHRSRASLSKAWTFPSGPQASTPLSQSQSVDKFFNCLEDSEFVDDLSSSPLEYSFERNKRLFARGVEDVDDGVMPFDLPPGVVGTEVEVHQSTSILGVVLEEEEPEEDDSDKTQVEDDDMFGDMGGIKITFTPPEPEFVEPLCKVKASLPVISASEEIGEEDLSFTDTPSPVRVPSTPASSSTPPSSIPRVSSSPSSIPRPSSFRASATEPMTPTKDMRRSVPSCNAFVTPPTKRGGTMPSFIPQPVSSPSPSRPTVASTKQKAAVPPITMTFIRQPQRKPLISSNSVKPQNGSSIKYQTAIYSSASQRLPLSRTSR